MRLLIFIFTLILSLNVFSQTNDDADKVVQQFLEQRKKMMEEIMKAFEEDDFFKGRDLFDDKMFDQIRKHGFKGFEGFNAGGNNVQVEEKVEKDGSISVIITPKNKNIKLDIKTTNNQIVIKSEMMADIENKNEQGTSRSYSRSSYSQTIAIPTGFDAKDPVKKGESIVISLVPKEKGNFKPDNKGRVPVQKGYGEETI